MKGFAAAQRAYDNMQPPEYWDDSQWDDVEDYCQECEASPCECEICAECECNPCECTYCKDCKTVNGCSCDEQYQSWKERDL